MSDRLSPPSGEPETLVVTAAAFTDTGRVRSHNEDFVAYHVPKDPAARAAAGVLLIVCDGVGGSNAGEVASEHAVRRILNDYYANPDQRSPRERLIAAVQQANQDIFARNADQPEGRRMTTTVVAAAIVGRTLILVHAGDSRAYLVRAEEVTQLTEDHSWVREMVVAGELTPEEAERHPWRNRITRAVGLREVLKLDVQEVELTAGDHVVLCSDGLTRHVADQEIAETVRRGDSSHATLELVNLANQRGGGDNVSVLIADLASHWAPHPAASGAGPSSAGRRSQLPLWIALIAVALVVLVAAFVLLRGRLTERTSSQTPAAPISPEPTLNAGLAPSASPTPTWTVSLTPEPTSTIRPTHTVTPWRSPTATTAPPTLQPAAGTTPLPAADTAPPEPPPQPTVAQKVTAIAPPSIPALPTVQQ